MAINKLDRIMIGEIEDSDNLQILGKSCFKMHSKFEDWDYAGRARYWHHIVGKLSNGEKIWGQSISSTLKKEDITKQKFLEELNEDLIEMNAYLTEAKYSNPAFGKKRVEGILYQEN